MKFVKKREHIDLPFKNSEILPVTQLRDVSMAKTIWKTQNDDTFLDTISSVKKLIAMHGIIPNDRNTLKLVAPSKRTLQARNSIFYTGIREWNKIPSDIKSSKTIGTFKRKYRLHLLGKLNI